MRADSLVLRTPRVRDEDAGRRAHEVLADAGYGFFHDYEPDEPWERLVDRVDRHRRGVDLPGNRVAGVFLIAWVGGEIVGRASIRYELNDYMATAGGHIGYAVLPLHRRRGYATEILRQSLIVARAYGVDDVLVTCDVDNVGSRAVIERCGGDFESTIHDPFEQVEKRRYWIR